MALRALAEYAGLFIAPVHLHMERDVLPFGRGNLATTIEIARDREFQTLLGALLVAALAVWARWAWRRDRAVFAGLVCFVIAYLPICGLFSLNASVAEHWLYVPGAFLLMAALLSLGAIKASRACGVTVVALWAVFLAVRTFARNPDWHDQRTFLERTIADGGGSARMLINLGGLDLTEGNVDRAIAELQKALELSPDQPFALMTLGAAYLHKKQYEAARGEFEKALAMPITRPGALQALAVVDFQEYGKDRMDLLDASAELAPEDWDIQQRYILHMAERGQNAAAMTELKQIVANEPWRAEPWKLLGDFWTRLGQVESAERAYRNAAALDVHDDETAAKLAAVEKEMPPR